MKTNLVFTLDENFVMPAAVSITSCLKHLPEDAAFDLRLVDGGVSDSSQERLHKAAKQAAGSRNIDIKWLKADQSSLPNLENYEFRNSKFNQSNTLRYALESIVTEDCEKVMFLDCDIVVKDDVLKMTSMMDGKPICAIRDYTIPSFGQRFSEKVPEWLNHCKAAMYFNSGVFTADMKYWRENKISRKLCEHIENEPETCRWPGQDPFNFTFANNWHEIDLAWNVQTGAPDRLRRLGADEIEFLDESYESIRRRAKIIHFTGNKPWNQGFTNPDRPVWVKALEQSGWFSPVEIYRWKAGWWGSLMQRGAGKIMNRLKPA